MIIPLDFARIPGGIYPADVDRDIIPRLVAGGGIIIQPQLRLDDIRAGQSRGAGPLRQAEIDPSFLLVRVAAHIHPVIRLIVLVGHAFLYTGVLNGVHVLRRGNRRIQGDGIDAGGIRQPITAGGQGIAAAAPRFLQRDEDIGTVAVCAVEHIGRRHEENRFAAIIVKGDAVVLIQNRVQVLIGKMKRKGRCFRQFMQNQIFLELFPDDAIPQINVALYPGIKNRGTAFGDGGGIVVLYPGALLMVRGSGQLVLQLRRQDRLIYRLVGYGSRGGDVLKTKAQGMSAVLDKNRSPVADAGRKLHLEIILRVLQIIGTISGGAGILRKLIFLQFLLRLLRKPLDSTGLRFSD